MCHLALCGRGTPITARKDANCSDPDRERDRYAHCRGDQAVCAINACCSCAERSPRFSAQFTAHVDQRGRPYVRLPGEVPSPMQADGVLFVEDHFQSSTFRISHRG